MFAVFVLSFASSPPFVELGSAEWFLLYVPTFLAVPSAGRCNGVNIERMLYVLRLILDNYRFLTTWPSVVSEDIVFDCLNNYRRATVWVPPAVCCVCGLERVDVTDVVVDNGAQSSFDFSNLFVEDPHIADLTGFQYGSPAIDGTVFDTSAMTISETSRVVLKVCVECLSALKRNRIPRLSLANYLYRGKLPSELQDLTWVEEMVCAKY